MNTTLDLVYTSIEITELALPLVGGAIIVGLGGGIIGWIGVRIWSKIMSWEQKQNAKRAELGEE